MIIVILILASLEEGAALLSWGGRSKILPFSILRQLFFFAPRRPQLPKKVPQSLPHGMKKQSAHHHPRCQKTT